MKERPILMCGEMVRATIDDRKHQTRRVADLRLAPLFEASLKVNGHVALKMLDGDIECPYGEAGDRLWVRETWGTNPCYDYLPPSKLTPHSFTREDEDYRATATEQTCVSKWRPSIFMPRWASRLTLEVTNVRVERLQDISVEDAVAEGVDLTPLAPDHTPDAKRLYQMLWDSINEDRAGCAWSCNPWVWVITFKRLT